MQRQGTRTHSKSGTKVKKEQIATKVETSCGFDAVLETSDVHTVPRTSTC